MATLLTILIVWLVLLTVGFVFFTGHAKQRGTRPARVPQHERPRKRDHNDRDYECRYWWGDRNGSAVGVANERCLICNPAPVLDAEIQRRLARPVS